MIRQGLRHGVWVLLLLHCSVAPLAAQTEVVNAFKSIRNTTVWPVSQSTLDAIESTFGPRIQVSTNAYDWHRGIDIDAPLGIPVLAAAAGELWNVTTFTDGGTTVILRHTFPAPVTYAGKSLSRYYTFYMHLNSVAADLVTADQAGQHPAVAVGQVIGAVGHSGTAVGDHLHFELRVGSQCSLEYQLANPTSSCSGYGFDPAMHSMLLFPPLTPDMTLTLLKTPTGKANGQVRFGSPDEQPLLNRIEYAIKDRRSGKVVASHILDFNQRIGFNATSTLALDTADTTKPYMSPLTFGTTATRYQTDVIIPKTFTGSFSGSNYQTTLTAIDIWGISVVKSW